MLSAQCSPVAELCRDCGYWKAMYLFSIGQGPEPDRDHYGEVYNVFMEDDG